MIFLYSYCIMNKTEVPRHLRYVPKVVVLAGQGSESSLSAVSSMLKSLSTSQLANGLATTDLESINLEFDILQSM